MSELFTPPDMSKTSIFHGGMAKIIRLDKIRNYIHRCRVEHNYTLWADFAKAWRNELYQDMHDEEIKEYKEIENKINQAVREQRKVMEGKARVNKLPIYDLLDEYTNWLTIVEDRQGYGAPKKGAGGESAGIV